MGGQSPSAWGADAVTRGTDSAAATRASLPCDLGRSLGRAPLRRLEGGGGGRGGEGRGATTPVCVSEILARSAFTPLGLVCDADWNHFARIARTSGGRGGAGGADEGGRGGH